MKIYVAGHMTGLPEYNFPAFRAAAKDLRDRGYRVVSPVELDEENGFDEKGTKGEALDRSTYGAFLQRDLAAIMEVDALACLDGWENSKGAAVEVAFARSLGLDVLRYPDLEPVGIDEVRVVNEITGGAKGTKSARFDLLPWDVLTQLATLYGKGAEKYEDNNWRKGYAWSLSAAALGRHLAAFMSGEEFDSETGCHHLTSVIFHACALIYFRDAHPELNDLWWASKTNHSPAPNSRLAH